MTRKKMLKALKGLKGYKIANLTMTYDMGLEIDYATSEGIGANFGNIGQWPLIKIVNKGLSSSWTSIQSHIKNGTLTHQIIEETTIIRFVKASESSYGVFEDNLMMSDNVENKKDDVSNPTLSEFLKPLCTLTPEDSEEFYILFDTASWHLVPLKVFKDKKCAWAALRELVGDEVYTLWEDMDDDELSQWYNELEDRLSEEEFEGIVYSEYSPDDEEEED